MNQHRSENWTTVINSVRTPLGLFTLLALILDGVLIAVSASTAKISIWAPILLLALLILCLTIIVLINPKALFHPRDWPLERHVKVILRFPQGINPINIDLMSDNCTLEIRDLHGRKKLITKPELRIGQDVWYLLLADVEPTDSVRLELVDSNNQRWKILPFDPFETRVDARHIQ